MSEKKEYLCSTGLWARVTKAGGRKYYSAASEILGRKVWISVFKNDRKKSEKAPDLNIIISEREDKQKEKPNDSEPMF